MIYSKKYLLCYWHWSFIRTCLCQIHCKGAGGVRQYLHSVFPLRPTRAEKLGCVLANAIPLSPAASYQDKFPLPACFPGFLVLNSTIHGISIDVLVLLIWKKTYFCLYCLYPIIGSKLKIQTSAFWMGNWKMPRTGRPTDLHDYPYPVFLSWERVLTPGTTIARCVFEVAAAIPSGWVSYIQWTDSGSFRGWVMGKKYMST